MKTLIFPNQSPSRLLINPLACASLPFFFAMAFLPGILQLVLPNSPVATPLAALGPAAAGFWLAIGLQALRLNFALLGFFLTMLLWAANWLMTADGGCCAAGH